jgi:serine/threonine protein kinase
MGVVYGVVNESGVEGAMKVMLPSLVKAPEIVARFFQEARLLATLKHPNIVRIIDFDRLADGTPFVVMERLKGRTLGKALRALRESGGLTPSLAYEIIRQLCEGLHFAHSHDPPIVHRDVKPENVFVHAASTDTVLIKLIDFGIAAVMDGSELARALGTPRYMAPELLAGEPASPQSDIYSVALLLYQMLTDRFPWDADIQSAAAMASAHLKLEPAPPSRYAAWIPSAVDECLLQALAKDPKARPSSAHEFSANLCVLQFVNDSRSKSVIDIDSTPLTRERDLVELAALAGVTKDQDPDGSKDEDAAPETAPELALTPVLPRKRHGRTLVTGMFSIAAALFGSAGAVVLARSTPPVARGAPASSAVAQSVGEAADRVPARPPRVEARPRATASAAGARAPKIAVVRTTSNSEIKTDGGFEAAFIPIENSEAPFLPEKP